MSETSESELGARDLMEIMWVTITFGAAVATAVGYASQAVYGHSAAGTAVVSFGTGALVAVAAPLTVYAVARMFYEPPAQGPEATTEEIHD